MTGSPAPDRPARAITGDPALLAQARRNALRPLVRCLFAESILDVTRLVPSPDGRAAWLPLPGRDAQLHFARLVVAPACTVNLDGPAALVGMRGDRQPVEDPDAFLDLVRDPRVAPVRRARRIFRPICGGTATCAGPRSSSINGAPSKGIPSIPPGRRAPA